MKMKFSLVDNETGEVVDQTNKGPESSKVENYVKFFYTDPSFHQGLSSNAIVMLFAIASRMPYSGSPAPVCVSSYVKKRISEQYGLSAASIGRGLTELVKTECLYRVQRGEYLVNPYMFGRGSGAAIRARREEWDSLVGHPHGIPATGLETASENETAPA